MVPLKLLLRAAARLQPIWQVRAKHTVQTGRLLLERLAAQHHDLKLAQHLAGLARAKGFPLCAARQDARVLALLTAVEQAAADALRVLQQPAPIVPSLSSLIAELHQIEAEFNELQVDNKQRFLGATTEPITLGGVELGPFAIRFFWERFPEQGAVACFDLVALEPNPAAGYERVTHPHVKDRRLCAGQATLALGKALEDGRLADAFCLIRSVLRYYNAGSPHVPLDEWEGRECEDCGRRVDEDDRTTCQGCTQDFCFDCMRDCSLCDAARCADCMTICPVCDEPCCARCVRTSAYSHRDCCSACLRNCASCGMLIASDELSPGSDRCPTCTTRQVASGSTNATSLAHAVTTAYPASPSPENDNATTLEQPFAPAPVPA
jgi:hypothetical protein